MNIRLDVIATVLAAAAGSIVLSGCMSAAPPVGMPDASVIGFTPADASHAIAPLCKTLDQRSHLVDAGQQRPGVAFGCATYSNLAAMISRPADLVAPLPYAGVDASVATRAVRLYEERGMVSRSNAPTASSTSSPLSAPATASQ